MKRTHACFLLRALRLRKLALELAVVPPGTHYVSVAQGSEVFQPEVNADGPGCFAATRAVWRAQLHADVDIPPAARVLADITRAQFIVCQTVAVPQRKGYLAEK